MTEQVRLSDVCLVKGGKRLPKGTDFSKEKTAYPYIRVADFQNGSVNTKNLKYLDYDTHIQIKRYMINRDDVYISITGNIGIVGMIPDELDGTNLTENAARLIIKDKSILDRDFLALFLQSPFGQKQIRKRTNIVGQSKLALTRIATINFPLLSLSEQKRIAAILNEQLTAVEKARVSAKERIEAAKTLPAAYLRAVFESPEAEKWSKIKFEEVSILQRGYDLPSHKQKPGDYPIITSSGIKGSHNAYQAKGPGIITGRNGSIGKVFFIDKDYWPHNTTLFVKDFKGNIPKYIFYLLQWLDLKIISSGSAVPTLDRKNVHKLVLPHPSIAKQKEIVSSLDKKTALAEYVCKQLEDELKTIEKLTAALLRQAFNGEL